MTTPLALFPPEKRTWAEFLLVSQLSMCLMHNQRIATWRAVENGVALGYPWDERVESETLFELCRLEQLREQLDRRGRWQEHGLRFQGMTDSGDHFVKVRFPHVTAESIVIQFLYDREAATQILDSLRQQAFSRTIQPTDDGLLYRNDSGWPGWGVLLGRLIWCRINGSKMQSAWPM